MALDERYILDETLGQYFVDKDTGEPLANGKIYFYEDDNRNTLKNVYELTGSPPNYTYAALANPVSLNAAGKPVDADGNNVALYYYPYDDFGNVQNYYIVVKSSSGTAQFTREAWPNIQGANDPLSDNNSITNELSNPQFHDVLFDYTNGLTVTYTGSGSTVIPIAPDWVLSVSHTNNGSITIGRTAVAGTSYLPTNPPYTLDITPGANCNGLELRQRLDNNPALWSSIAGEGGYVATSLTVNDNRQISVYYRPSTPGESAQQTLLSDTNTSGGFAELRNTVQLTAVSNTDTGETGYIDIVFSLPVTGQTRITSCQVVGLSANESDIAYNQVPVNRLKDQLFNYYNAPLQAKQVDSYLIGWDFPKNPAQWGATYAAAAVGANKSAYVWDQTIIYQSVNSGFSAARTSTGSLEITIAQNNTQIALIQYLEQEEARKILNGELSVHISANKSAGANVSGTVSLWYTTGALPAIATNDAIVASLGTNGTVATQNGTWLEVARNNLGDARFTLTSSSTANFNEIGLTGWDHQGGAGATTATYFAIVVGFAAMSTNEKIDINSISLMPGKIPSKPAPKTIQQTTLDCNKYFFKTFKYGVVPVANLALGSGEWRFPNHIASPNSGESYTNFQFPVEMAKTPTITIYSPVAGGGSQIYNIDTGTLSSGAASVNVSTKNTAFTYTATAGWGSPQRAVVHFTADARLG